ncbi:MAG: glycine cleavage system protein GcvH [Acholeplasmataceae bacterium]
MIKKGLLYSETHEWVKHDGDISFIGISDYAQDTLGAVVFVDLPNVGATFKKDDIFGAVESVKAASDLYAPVSFKILEVNEALVDTPELLNTNPYDNWILKVTLLNDKELENLLTDDAYEACCK